LEAASIGYEMQSDDLAMRCNIITLSDNKIKNHHGGHLNTDDGTLLIEYLNKCLGNDRIKFIPGIQYRHLLVIRGGSKEVDCAPPHDHPNEPWQPLLPKPNVQSAEDTAKLLNDLILKSQDLLAEHPFNIERQKQGKDMANSIWPWSGGYRPQMQTLMEMYPQIKRGDVISAVDLIRGIGRYAGLRSIEVEGATGLANTNYEGKAQAAIEALRHDDFVFLHVEASDEAGHDGDLDLKLQTIEDLDRRIVTPIYNEVKQWDEPVCIAILPDHPTPVEIRTHLAEPVPFLIWHRGIKPDEVQAFDEVSCVNGSYGLLRYQEFMNELMKI
jgi:2,3-bisphosphoglycerate-independent phosphoglycerate mutase